MDDPLQGLIRELRSQKCPPTVLDRVAGRIARERNTGRLHRPRWAVAMSLVAVLALGMIAVWRQPSPRINPGTVAANTRAQRALVARQAEVTLASIGHALIEAAARTENIISKRDRSAVAE